ncbi:hypothetical protein GCM10023084_74010 [Streptomyces lacrimifluminis]|uniref:Uncharacterized protein n=1 Tax=Streptomyces lacrimifluminis TaxID=1500077 RepID=A0A917P6U1_9ACTN|nr:hypothetical protein [Streptomyces lacrimifluminis]GGJ64511.1 hypothetical protein GCM10012282_72070 [Streptomyces lacrimifluminis]
MSDEKTTRLDMGDPLEWVAELGWMPGRTWKKMKNRWQSNWKNRWQSRVSEVVVEAVADRVLDVIEPMAGGMGPSSRCGTIGASNHR